MKTIRIIFPMIAMFFMLSCSKENNVRPEEDAASNPQNELAASTKVQGRIANIRIPEESMRVDPVKIKVTAIGDSGCWKNLRVDLRQVSKFRYELRSYGDVGGSNCAAIDVTAEKEISFTPTAQGTYTVVVYKTPTVTVEKKVRVLFTR